jgi:pimeloyl-ACP methyl ester carboxylesterase
MPEIELAAGTVRYRDEGSGRPIVFVHGALVDGRLWDEVVSRLSGAARCVVPDLPLGAHRIAMRRDADLSPPGLADLVAELLERLDLRDVTLVGNDTGGALCQFVVTRHPSRVARLVLTNCDAFDNFPPALFRPLGLLGRARLLTAALQPMRLRALRRLPFAYGWLTKRRLPDSLLDAWVEPFFSDAGVRRDTRRFLVAIDREALLDNTALLHDFDGPVLIAWAPEDRFFPLEHARRLAAVFPAARLVEVADSYTFVALDQPERLAALIREHAA